jgi:hypothetical protein
MMIDDRDVLRAARFLIDRDGDGALSTAQQRAADLFLMGQDGAAEIWKQIAKAIAELKSSPPP